MSTDFIGQESESYDVAEKGAVQIVVIKPWGVEEIRKLPPLKKTKKQNTL